LALTYKILIINKLGHIPAAVRTVLRGWPPSRTADFLMISSRGLPEAVPTANELAPLVNDLHRRLEASDRKYQTLVDNLPEVVWSMTLSGKPTSVSRSVETVCAFTPADILDSSHNIWVERAHAEDLLRVRQAYASLVSTSQPLQLEYRWQRK